MTENEVLRSELCRRDLTTLLALLFGKSGLGFDTWELKMKVGDGEESAQGAWMRPLDVPDAELARCLAQVIDDGTAKELVQIFRAEHHDGVN
jgi:hypothetical protein